MRNETYNNGGKTGYSQTSAMLTMMKKCDDFAFLKVVDSIALQQSLRDLDRGFVNYFQKRAAHPVFRSKHDHHQSYRTINQGGNIRIVGKYIKLPKIGKVKAVIHRLPEADWLIKSATISQASDGTFYVSILFEYEKDIIQSNKLDNVIGLDYASDGLYVDSNGNKGTNHKFYKESHKNIERQIV